MLRRKCLKALIYKGKPCNHCDCRVFSLARKERFELSQAFYTSTPLAGEPLRPLGYFRRSNFDNILERMAERVGFEPTAHCCVTGFQDQLLKPLGHLSEYRPQRPRFILAYPFLFVNRFSGNDEDFSMCSWQKI